MPTLVLSKEKTLSVIFVTILSLFSIEYIAFGEFLSVYRLIIFPLSIMGLMLLPPKLTKQNIRFYLIISLVLCFNVFSGINARNVFLGIINAFGIFTFVLFVTNYISQYGISKKVLWIIALYSIPQYFSFLTYLLDFSSFNVLNTSARFRGFHKDPNFLSVYINFAIVAKIYLLSNTSRKFKKYIISAIFFDVILILFTQSRVGIFVLLLNFLIFLFYQNKKLLIISLIFVGIGLVYLKQLANNLDRRDATIVEAVASRFYNSDISMSNTSNNARVIHFFQFLDLVSENKTTIVGYSLENYRKKYKQYPHNIFIDIVLEIGLIMGAIFITYLSYLFLLSFYITIRKKYNPLLFHLAVSSFFGMMLLTSYKQKFFWLIVVFIFLSTKNIKIHINEK